MVNSKLNPLVKYEESEHVNKQDIGYASPIYELLMDDGNTIAIVFGIANISPNLPTYWPMYLIQGQGQNSLRKPEKPDNERDEIYAQIGVWEAAPGTKEILLNNVVDDKNNIDVDGHYRLFSFATSDFLALANSINYDKDDDNDDEDGKDDEDNDKDGNWINKIFSSSKFDIKTVPGDGNCFFYCVKDALQNKSSVGSLRAIVSRELKDEHYDNLMIGFKTLSDIRQNLEKEETKLQSKIQKLKKSRKTDNFEARSKLTTELEHVMARIVDNDNDLHGYEFAENFDSIDDYREYVMTADYWADSVAIDILEQKLQVKFIIFQQPSSLELDSTTLLSLPETYVKSNTFKDGTGNGNDDSDGIITNSSTIRYIFLNFKDGNHFDLITFNGMKSWQEKDFNPMLKKFIRKLKT